MMIADHRLQKETTLDKTIDIDDAIRNIAKVLEAFDPITLMESQEVKLMERTDTKFVFQEALLPEILVDLAHAYYVLDVDGLRMHRYKTRYFDTPDFKFYRQHHNGQRDRFKLRVRSYLDTDEDFLEVKRKDNHNRTRKSRLPSEAKISTLSPEVQSFLDASLPANDAIFIPTLVNSFYRISLVSKHDKERLTLDFDIQFLSPTTQFTLPGIVIAEVKQPRFSVQSAFIRKMREQNHRSTSFSKYCVGAALAYPNLRRNKFKPLLLNIQKFILGANN
jgi:hypothetical protein